MTLEEIIQIALDEDLGSGDHSSLATIPATARGSAVMLAKENGIVAGLQVAKQVFTQFDRKTKVELLKKEGQSLQAGDKIMKINGLSRSLLAAERTSLNFIQRLSGIATFTHKVVQKLEGLNTRVLDTRKTTPGLRMLEKMAVRAGGGENHRFGLYDMIMIKDNHIDFAGGITEAISRTKAYLKKNHLDLKIEIEVRNFYELENVLKTGDIQRVMLDNFSPDDLRSALKLINGRFETEASGGISINNIRQYAETGVDFISVGALTHQIKSLDISLIAL